LIVGLRIKIIEMKLISNGRLCHREPPQLCRKPERLCGEPQRKGILFFCAAAISQCEKDLVDAPIPYRTINGCLFHAFSIIPAIRVNRPVGNRVPLVNSGFSKCFQVTT
jgi:hypothetical protein